MDPIALAQDLPSVQTFGESLLLQLNQTLGFEAAHLIRVGDELHATAWGLGCERLGFQLREEVERYEPDTRPLRQAALAQRGVAVDTDVLGASRWQCRYFRELALPIGGRHTLMAFPRLRGTELGVLVLGRCRQAWCGREVAVVEELLPSLAVAWASYARERNDGADQPPKAVALPNASTACLSPRERDVLDYLCLGYTNAEIARACGTSPNTVRNQLVSVFKKIGATTRSEAVALACRTGLGSRPKAEAPVSRNVHAAAVASRKDVVMNGTGAISPNRIAPRAPLVASNSSDVRACFVGTRVPLVAHREA